MKKSAITLLGGALALTSLNAAAISLSGSVADNAQSVQLSQSLMPGWSTGIGYFNSDDSGRNAKAWSGQLMFSPWLPGVDLSLGGRYQYLDSDYGDGGGLGLGGSAYVDTPIPLVSVGGYGFYTPSGLTHGDIDSSRELGARARAQFIPGLQGFVGYRYYRVDFDNHDDRTLFSGPELGVSFGF
ncbi:YfaZ family outer membrane protein [Kushneria aurantia]|uniref:YfaZ family outer membrane protein n=1 Tax=Kushneria aurantia TaxID=504092 RepID=A0ABV6G0E7_9GAMM|nr:YfaZ family outer membrane protein [Kushneria aurantia]